MSNPLVKSNAIAHSAWSQGFVTAPYGSGGKLLADDEVGLILDKYTKAIASQFKPKLP